MYILEINKGDYVTRNSYDNDTIFKVINIKNNIVYLKGVDVRLVADADITDLRIEKDIFTEDELDDIEIKEELLTRGEYFYLPAKILHIDGDEVQEIKVA